MPTKRRTSFTDLPQNASKELVSLQDSLIRDLSDLRQETIGITTDTKVGPYAARYNESIRSLPPTAGTTMTFPPADSTTQNRWIEIMKLGGGALTIRPTSLLIDGAASVTLTTAGLYSYRSDGGTSWWRAASASGGLSPPVALTDLQQVTGPTLLGRVSALGSILALTAAQFTSIINLFTAALSGTVPASGGGTTNFLRADGSWAAPPAGGGTPTGTGFRHVTAGTEDAATKLVDTADINNLQVTGAKVANNTITHAQEAQPAGNTIPVNATAGVANWTDLALAIQSIVLRQAANIVQVSATAGQVLGRTIAGGDLGFITPPGALLRAPQIVLASNAAFAHAAGTRFAVVEGQAAGGAGGGCAATAGAMGNGGNAGNWGRKTFTISGTSAIVIGAVGAGASAAVGGNAANSSFTNNAVALTLPGGLGGAITAGGATIAIAAANAGNAASTGQDIGDTGRLGRRAFRNTTVAGTAISGDGGSSRFGSGGFGLGATAAAGEVASGFGGGGGGAVAATAGTANAGGNGSPAFFIVWDFG